MKIRAPGSPTLAPDGTLFVVDWPDGVNQVFRREAGAPVDGPMRQLTQLEDGVNGYALSPDGSTIVVTAAIGGSEQNDLFRLDPVTGEMETLHGDPGVVYTFHHWLADSSDSASGFSTNTPIPRSRQARASGR